MPNLPAVVIDTNVLFAGLTKQGGVDGLIINLWHKELILVYVSDALAYEYIDVLSRKLSPQRWLTLEPVVKQLLQKVQFATIHFSWRPISPDPGDDFLIDCALNSGAMIVTANVRDFKQAQKLLPLQVLTPPEFVEYLSTL